MARKKPPAKAVTFRVPLTQYAVLSAVAEERGIDLTAMLNSLIADALPALERWLEARRSPGLPISWVKGAVDEMVPDWPPGDRDVAAELAFALSLGDEGDRMTYERAVSAAMAGRRHLTAKGGNDAAALDIASFLARLMRDMRKKAAETGGRS